MDFLNEYYSNYCNEDQRLTSQHGQVEYITTQKYIHEFLEKLEKPKILKVGAGTGRYSIALAKEGYSVTAVELIEHNINILKSNLKGDEPIEVLQGNALDLSKFCDDTFDMTLLLGPMYHLYTKEDKVKALKEAVRVTKKGGYIMVAYCMNESCVIQHAFMHNNLKSVLEDNLFTDDWHCVSEPKELFDLIRTEEIEELNSFVDAVRIKFIATDGATNYLKECVDAMDEFTFNKWLEFHLATCERQDLIGAANHTLDILQKK